MLIYQASATGRCSRAYMDVFTCPYKSIPYAFSPKLAELLQDTMYFKTKKFSHKGTKAPRRAVSFAFFVSL